MRRAILAAAVVALTAAGGQAQAAAFNPDPVFPVGRISGSVSHQIAKLDHVASVLAGRRAIVNCWSQHDWARLQTWQAAHHHYALADASGMTSFRTHRIQLAPFICQILQQVIARSAQQPLYTAAAVTLLAHESAHASGIKAENVAECTALKTEPRAAQLLRIPKALAVRFQHIYRGTIYPHEGPRYRTPPCKTGLPGVIAPDTLGSAANLRPLKRTAAAVAHLFRGWRNVGGDVGPLSPCAPVRSRAFELARFAEVLLGPLPESVVYTGARIRTAREFAATLRRYRELPRCDLALIRVQLRESHSTDTVSNGRIPPSIARLSPHVRAFREIYTSHGKKWDRDTIVILDPAERTTAEIFFRVPVGKLPVSLELRVTKKLLHGLPQSH